MKKKVWYITGASKGLGLALVKTLLTNGYLVAATTRNLEELEKAVNADRSRFLPLEVILTDESSIRESIRYTVAHFGGLDVVVNNAGYGLTGALEELTDAEARANFDINVFGSLNVIRQVMPHLREQQSGHIFNIASIGGFAGGFAGFGIYCATKFAVHGFTESLAHEVKDFGIHATVIMPGYFRTDFLSGGSLRMPANKIADYQQVREIEASHTDAYNGNQPGDPDKAAAAILQVYEMPEPPIHVFLGQDAYELATAKMATVNKDMRAVADFAAKTGFNQE